MKRLVVVIVMMIGIISVCVYARHRVSTARERLHLYAHNIFTYIEREDEHAIGAAVKSLHDYWQEEYIYLILFFRHSEVDEVSRSVSKLKSYADFEEYADLHAELCSVLWQIDHIWQSERVRLGAVFLRSIPYMGAQPTRESYLSDILTSTSIRYIIA